MKRRKWTEYEIEYLKENFGKIPDLWISKTLDMSRYKIARKAKSLGLKCNFKRIPVKTIELLKTTQMSCDINFSNAKELVSVMCPFCKNEFKTTANRIAINKIRSCGCTRLGKRKGTEHLSKTLISHCKFSAKYRNIEYNLSDEYLEILLQKQNFKCALSGVVLIYGYRKLSDCTISLDRIDSSKAYIEGNVQWVHKDINIIKQYYSQEYFITMCNNVSNFQKDLLKDDK